LLWVMTSPAGAGNSLGACRGMAPMCVVCQEGKFPAVFDHQSGLQTKNRAS
jgi:hypothetical protein